MPHSYYTTVEYTRTNYLGICELTQYRAGLHPVDLTAGAYLQYKYADNQNTVSIDYWLHKQ